MYSSRPKVLHAVAGRTLLGHVVHACAPLNAAETLVVVGHGSDDVLAEVARLGGSVRPVHQAEQRGTGHATRLALEAVPGLEGTVVVVPGDAPLLLPTTLQALVEAHTAGAAAVTLLTAEVPDPTGYGRVVRRSDGGVHAVVEERDATPVEQAIREVNTSVYAFDTGRLRSALGQLTADNAQGEEYLTDVVALLVAQGEVVAALVASDAAEVVGVNDRAQLAAAGAVMRDRVVRRAMLAGATVVDPASTWVDVDVVLHPDCVVEPATVLRGRTVVDAGAAVGPNATLTDTVVGAGAVVRASTCDGAEIGPDARVGPYSYLRPGARLGPRSKVGAFVEVKGAEIGEDAKVPHLSYVGDATIGARANIGAATVFVNYDGRAKHRTTVGEDAKVGSDTMLVAPVAIGPGAYTAAGSVITQDVPAGALGIGRARQRNVEDWVARRRGTTGTPPPEQHGQDPSHGHDDQGAPQ